MADRELHESTLTPCRGRERELATIAASLDRTAEGVLGALLISGEPGIGKSRLVLEAAQLARARGFAVLHGYALEGGALPPLFPLARALDGVALTAAADERGATLRAAVLASVGLGSATAATLTPPALTVESNLLRLCEAFSETLATLCSRRPVLLLLDDLQWAAAPTLDLLVYVARRLVGTPLLFVLASRDDALLDAQTPIARAALDFGRLRRLQHLPLSALGEPDIKALVGDLVGERPAAPLVQQLAARSGGNPFFVEELVRAGAYADGDAATPAAATPLTLRLAVQQRLDRLPQQTLKVLAGGAVLGRFFELALLRDVLALERTALDRALVPALDDGILRLEGDRGVFAHDVIREVVLLRERAELRQLHGVVAAALERQRIAPVDDDVQALLAFHWQQAGEAERAGLAFLAAGESALAQQRPAEALHFARDAAVALRSGSNLGADRSGRAALLLGQAALASGDFAAADATLRSALVAASAAGEQQRVGRIWLELGRLLRRRERHDEAVRALHQALAALGVAGPFDASAIEALIELAGVEAMSRGRYAAAAEFGERAIALAREQSRAVLEARAALVLADARGRAGEPDAVRTLLELAVDRATSADDAALGAEACASLANVCYWTGDLRASRRFAEQRLALALQTGDPFALRHAHSWLALLAWTRGDLAAADALLGEAQRFLTNIDSAEPVAFAQLVAGMIAFRRGDLALACERISGAVRLFETVDDAAVWYAGWEAIALIAAGRDAEAETAVRAQERRIAALPAGALPARSGRNFLALAQMMRGDREAALGSEARLSAFPDDFHWTPVRRTLAAIAALRGDTTAALALLATAERHARSQELQPEVALILFARADLLSESDPSRQRCRREAEAIVARLGIVLPERTVRQRGRHSESPLSEREIEVLRLVAQGCSNREIAAALVLSERTVINHISHIFTRLDVPNRAAATAYAFQHHLA